MEISQTAVRRRQTAKKYTANGLVRKGCPKGQPVVRFGIPILV